MMRKVNSVLYDVKTVDGKKHCFPSSLKILVLKGTPRSSWAANSKQTKDVLLHITKLISLLGVQ